MMLIGVTYERASLKAPWDKLFDNINIRSTPHSRLGHAATNSRIVVASRLLEVFALDMRRLGCVGGGGKTIQ